MRARMLSAVLLLAAIGCEDEVPQVLSPGMPPPAIPQPAAIAATPAASAPQAEPPAERTYRDIDFVESEQNRDPFHSYAVELRVKAPAPAQRLVLMPEVPIDQMRLIAIVSGIEQPRAMIVDPQGVGYVATRGDFLGKADVVQGGGADSLPVALNWRVDRIRENEVVLAREDPSAPGRAPLMKVIPLHEEDPAGTPLKLGRNNG